MKQVIFYIKKDTNKFRRYQIIQNKTEEEIVELINKINMSLTNPETIILVRDQHVIDAITQKDDQDSLRSLLDDFRDQIKGVESSIDNIKYILENLSARIDEKEN
jgi:hypothetical protein